MLYIKKVLLACTLLCMYLGNAHASLITGTNFDDSNPVQTGSFIVNTGVSGLLSGSQLDQTDLGFIRDQTGDFVDLFSQFTNVFTNITPFFDINNPTDYNLSNFFGFGETGTFQSEINFSGQFDNSEIIDGVYLASGQGILNYGNQSTLLNISGVADPSLIRGGNGNGAQLNTLFTIASFNEILVDVPEPQMYLIFFMAILLFMYRKKVIKT